MESPKFSKKFDARGWMIWVLCYVYAVLSEHLTKIGFGLKINLAMNQVTWIFNIRVTSENELGKTYFVLPVQNRIL